MRTTLILSKSTQTANAYAKLVGLDRFTYRAVRSAASIKGIRNAEVHILPDFLARIDRHAILSTLRWAKLDVYYVDPADFEEDPPQLGGVAPRPVEEVVSGTPATLEEIEEAYQYDLGLELAAIREQALADFAERERAGNEEHEESDGAETGAPEPVEEPAPKPRKPRKPREPKATEPEPAPAAEGPASEGLSWDEWAAGAGSEPKPEPPVSASNFFGS